MEEVVCKDQPVMSMDYENIPNVTGRNRALKSGSGEESKVPAAAAGLKLFRLVILSFGVLCFLQAVLNIFLRLALSSETRCDILTEEKEVMESMLNTLILQNEFLTEERDKLKNIVQTPGWVYFRDSVFYLSSIKKTWQESRNDCLQKGADLMIINNKEEQDFTRHLKDNLWIGLTKMETEETWKWVDGTPVTTSYFASYISSGNTSENCGEIISQLMKNNWNDRSCHNLNFWICEMKISV